MEDLQWFEVPAWWSTPPDAVADQLEAIGVRLQEPEGLACYFLDPATRELLKEVGTIIVAANQVIEVLPRHDLSGDDLRALLGCAEDAFRHPPTRAGAWQRHRSRHRGTWWSADVIVPVDCADDAVGRQVAHHESSQSAWQRSSL